MCDGGHWVCILMFFFALPPKNPIVCVNRNVWPNGKLLAISSHSPLEVNERYVRVESFCALCYDRIPARHRGSAKNLGLLCSLLLLWSSQILLALSESVNVQNEYEDKYRLEYTINLCKCGRFL